MEKLTLDELRYLNKLVLQDRNITPVHKDSFRMKSELSEKLNGGIKEARDEQRSNNDNGLELTHIFLDEAMHINEQIENGSSQSNEMTVTFHFPKYLQFKDLKRSQRRK